MISAGAGRESIEAAKCFITTTPEAKDTSAEPRQEEGYRILTEIYIRRGLKKEAVETSRQALDVHGDKAHLRAYLGFTYLTVGDREGALAQYRILKEGAERAEDENTKALWRLGGRFA